MVFVSRFLVLIFSFRAKIRFQFLRKLIVVEMDWAFILLGPVPFEGLSQRLYLLLLGRCFYDL